MAEGSIISLTYGFMLMLMAQAAIAQSVAIAALPTFSAQYALGKIDEMRMSLASTLRSMFLLALPASERACAWHLDEKYCEVASRR